MIRVGANPQAQAQPWAAYKITHEHSRLDYHWYRCIPAIICRTLSQHITPLRSTHMAAPRMLFFRKTTADAAPLLLVVLRLLCGSQSIVGELQLVRVSHSSVIRPEHAVIRTVYLSHNSCTVRNGYCTMISVNLLEI